MEDTFSYHIPISKYKTLQSTASTTYLAPSWASMCARDTAQPYHIAEQEELIT
jgi:hypothetical protein